MSLPPSSASEPDIRRPPSPPGSGCRGNLSDGERSLETAHNTDRSPADTPSSRQEQSPPEPPVKPPRLPPQRRAAHGRSGVVHSSIRSDCKVLHNSIRFRHNELDCLEDSSYSEDNSHVGSRGMEVMDLRPRRMTLRESVSSSLVSFSSNSSVDSELKLTNSARKYVIDNSSNDHGGLFRVASSSNGNSGGGGSGSTSGGDAPKHWEATTWAERGGESHHSFRALMSLMRGGVAKNNDTVSIRRGSLGRVSTDRSGASGFVSTLTGPPENDTVSRAGSLGSVSTNRSGRSGASSFISTFTGPHDSDDDIDFSMSGSETSSMWTESSPLMDRKNRLYVRRCARAIVGFVVLAALSGTVCYLVSEKDHKSMLEFLPGNNLLGRSLGNGNNSSEEQQEENDDQLMYRRLPQGGNVVAVSRAGSLGSVSTNRSGRSGASSFISTFTGPHDSDDDIDFSMSGSETSSMWTESSPLMDRKNRLYMRRCARAIAGFVALAALSGAVIIYCVAEEDRESVLGFLPANNFLGKLFGNGNNNLEEQQEEKIDQLRYRRLPQGGNVVEMVPASGVLGNDHYGKGNEQDEGYYNDGRQDYTTVHQDHLVVRRLNDPHQEHQEYNYNKYPFVEEGHRVLTQEDKGYHYVHQDHLVHENNLRE
eukprot:CAMPEP_0201947260 /NCGR_PEP_ID=MMETSP0903-20130614/54847_1 /ASSEMBLY_ACC=CAM_ASM_000552 /TAXON_ID=420261 /ORGANISM="Thalassiosira antarctica, Strain CCMP982" /LENGTH=648 /DNA_ID=CAMNT_0048490397 /DNA_START=33 /DNA_END=1979 /DNA_ORIENTATION=-